jgi:hypothetical protein
MTSTSWVSWNDERWLERLNDGNIRHIDVDNESDLISVWAKLGDPRDEWDPHWHDSNMHEVGLDGLSEELRYFGVEVLPRHLMGRIRT